VGESSRATSLSGSHWPQAGTTERSIDLVSFGEHQGVADVGAVA